MSGIVNQVGAKSGIISAREIGSKVVLSPALEYIHVGAHDPGGPTTSTITLTSSNYYILHTTHNHNSTSYVGYQYQMIYKITTDAAGAVTPTLVLNGWGGTHSVTSPGANLVVLSTNHASYFTAFTCYRFGGS